jgi:Flp pilus assembly protein TadG
MAFLWRTSAPGALRDERGATVVVVAIASTALIGVAALAIDASFLYVSRNKLQMTADAAALAGAAKLPTDANVRAEAIALAQLNMPVARNGNVLVAGDIVTGNWNKATKVFTAAGTPKNAVKVTTRRSVAGGNATPLFFASIFGFTRTSVIAEAIAEGSAGPGSECETNGFIADKILQTGSNNSLYGFCWYARQKVQIGSNDFFDANSQVGSTNLSHIQSGSDNVGLAGAKFEADMTPTLAGQVGQIINDLQSGAIAMPSYITQTVNVSSLPANPVPGRAYIVSGTAVFGSNKTLNNIVVIANGDVSFGSNVNLTNAVIASRSLVQMGSNMNIGDPNYCTSNTGSVQFLATGEVKAGSNDVFRGVQMIAGTDVDMGSNNDVAAYGVSAQGGRDVKIGSNVDMYACPTDIASHVRFSLGPKLRLVR